MQHTAGQLRSRKSGGGAGTKMSDQGETITFADVAGVDEAKEELEEIVVCQASFSSLWYYNQNLVIILKASCLFRKCYLLLFFTAQEFLRNPDRYVRVGARPPRGVLLVSFYGI